MEIKYADSNNGTKHTSRRFSLNENAVEVRSTCVAHEEYSNKSGQQYLFYWDFSDNK